MFTTLEKTGEDGHRQTGTDTRPTHGPNGPRRVQLHGIEAIIEPAARSSLITLIPLPPGNGLAIGMLGGGRRACALDAAHFAPGGAFDPSYKDR